MKKIFSLIILVLSFSIFSAYQDIGSIIADKNNTLWISSGDKIYCSSDKGCSWGKLDSTIFNLQAKNIYMDKDRLFIQSLNAIFSSSDMGLTWNKIFTGSTICNLKFHGKTIYVKTKKTIEYSKDEGVSWNIIDLASSADIINLATAIDKNGDILKIVTKEKSEHNWNPYYFFTISKFSLASNKWYKLQVDESIFKHTGTYRACDILSFMGDLFIRLENTTNTEGNPSIVFKYLDNGKLEKVPFYLSDEFKSYENYIGNLKFLKDSYNNQYCIIYNDYNEQTDLFINDNGKMRFLNSQPPGFSINNFVNLDSIYIGAGSSLFISRDNCKTWRQNPINQLKICKLNRIICLDNFVFGLSEMDGIYILNEKKLHWEKIFGIRNINYNSGMGEIESFSKSGNYYAPIYGIKKYNNKYYAYGYGLYEIDISKKVCNQLDTNTKYFDYNNLFILDNITFSDNRILSYKYEKNKYIEYKFGIDKKAFVSSEKSNSFNFEKKENSSFSKQINEMIEKNKIRLKSEQLASGIALTTENKLLLYKKNDISSISNSDFRNKKIIDISLDSKDRIFVICKIDDDKYLTYLTIDFGSNWIQLE